MNEDPSVIPPTDEETPEPAQAPRSVLHQAEDLIRHHPGLAILATVGFGCAVGVAARQLLIPPPPPKNRALQLLEDIQARLSEFGHDTQEYASHLADDGMDAVKRGAHSVSDSKLGQAFRRFLS